jgi:hypothetical protein
MNDEPIPPEVHQFLIRHVDSVAQLEALLLLRAHPGERWTAVRMAARIYTPEGVTAELLARLAGDGFLACADDMYWYDCRDLAASDTIDRLAATYKRHLIPVTNVIHAKPRRIREFADAFRFRKDR